MASAEVETIVIELESGARQETSPIRGTFAVELDRNSTAGEVSLEMHDGTTRDCVEPERGLQELAWTCR